MELGDRIKFPIQGARPGHKNDNGEGYSLVILDANNVNHYFNSDGTYDGWSSDPCVDGDTGINLN